MTPIDSSALTTHLRSLAGVPFTGLGARIGRFESPFEYLGASKLGFRPADRFLLNRCLAGEQEAIEAREQGIVYRIPEAVSGADAREAELAYNAYFRNHQQEIREFVRAEYPPAPRENETYDVAPKPPQLNAWVEEIVGGTMSGYGFDVKKGKQSKSLWKCRADIGGEAVEIEFSHGQWSTHGWLRVVNLPYYADLGAPFFFGQVGYWYKDAAVMRERLSLFMGEYAKLFPHVIETIGIAKPIREAVVAGNLKRAIELARAAPGIRTR